MNRNIDEIICFIEEITALNEGNKEKIKLIVSNSDFSNKYEILNVLDNLFLKNLVTCLVYSSINPFLANSPVMKQYQDKVVKICEFLGLNIENIRPICEIESELMSTLRVLKTTD
jgi:hypothetical protein